MIGAVVQHAICFLLFIQAEFHKRLTAQPIFLSSNRCFGNLPASRYVPSCCLRANACLHYEIQIIYYRQTIFEYIHITTGQTDRDFTRTIGTSRIQHDITITFLFQSEDTLVEALVVRGCSSAAAHISVGARPFLFIRHSVQHNIFVKFSEAKGCLTTLQKDCMR